MHGTELFGIKAENQIWTDMAFAPFVLVAFTWTTMIRRNPTLIPMTDSDVQDVREMVALQKEEEQKQQALIAQMKKMAEDAETLPEDSEMAEEQRMLQAKQDAKSEQRRRLGLDPGEPNYPVGSKQLTSAQSPP